jgi:hypothetical protein
MADTKITIRVNENRGSVNITYATAGQVAGLQTRGLTGDLLQQSIPPKTSASAWWLSVLATVQAAITAAEGS